MNCYILLYVRKEGRKEGNIIIPLKISATTIFSHPGFVHTCITEDIGGVQGVAI